MQSVLIFKQIFELFETSGFSFAVAVDAFHDLDLVATYGDIAYDHAGPSGPGDLVMIEILVWLPEHADNISRFGAIVAVYGHHFPGFRGGIFFLTFLYHHLESRQRGQSYIAGRRSFVIEIQGLAALHNLHSGGVAFLFLIVVLP